MRFIRPLCIPLLGLALAGCSQEGTDPGDHAPAARAASTEQAAAGVREQPAANGFIQSGDEQFPLETASLTCTPRATHDGISEIRFQTFGMGGEGLDAYTISAREQIHRNGTVTQHVSVAGQALGIRAGSESDTAEENGRNWPLYKIEGNRITVNAALRQSTIAAEWDVPVEFTEDCVR